MVQTVKDFVSDSYRLINAASPTVPLHGDDMGKGVQWLNQLIRSYSGTGLLLTVAKSNQYLMSIGQQFVTFADESYLPAADVQIGRLANLQNAYLVSEGLQYPLKVQNRNDFFSSWIYQPQSGLPIYAIVLPETNITTVQIYPSPSQPYVLNTYGKFELKELTQNDDLSSLPGYFVRFLQFALAKDISMYKSRSDAWSEKLEGMLVKAEQDMISVSSVNLKIKSDSDVLLNGSWRVIAGI